MAAPFCLSAAALICISSLAYAAVSGEARAETSPNFALLHPVSDNTFSCPSRERTDKVKQEIEDLLGLALQGALGDPEKVRPLLGRDVDWSKRQLFNQGQEYGFATEAGTRVEILNCDGLAWNYTTGLPLQPESGSSVLLTRASVTFTPEMTCLGFLDLQDDLRRQFPFDYVGLGVDSMAYRVHQTQNEFTRVVIHPSTDRTACLQRLSIVTFSFPRKDSTR